MCRKILPLFPSLPLMVNTFCLPEAQARDQGPLQAPCLSWLSRQSPRTSCYRTLGPFSLHSSCGCFPMYLSSGSPFTSVWSHLFIGFTFTCSVFKNSGLLKDNIQTMTYHSKPRSGSFFTTMSCSYRIPPDLASGCPSFPPSQLSMHPHCQLVPPLARGFPLTPLPWAFWGIHISPPGPAALCVPRPRPRPHPAAAPPLRWGLRACLPACCKVPSVAKLH